jgi:hypothetical protein
MICSYHDPRADVYWPVDRRAMPGRWKISRINIKKSIRAEAKVGSGVRSQEIRHNRMKFIGVS